MSAQDPEAEPLLIVVRGEPDDEEIAALIAAIMAVYGYCGDTDTADVIVARPCNWQNRDYRPPGAWATAS